MAADNWRIKPFFPISHRKSYCNPSSMAFRINKLCPNRRQIGKVTLLYWSRWWREFGERVTSV
jgi:hypothetical protein